jgi:hypothetical protein
MARDATARARWRIEGEGGHMRSRFRLLATILLAAAATAGCASGGSYIHTNAPLGRVVIYRNGVAYYERQAAVTDGKLMVRVPRERVDDFLKSLTVVDMTTQQPMPVTIKRQQAADGEYLEMALEASSRNTANVLLTYVTESPAWKPSYRIAVGGNGKVVLQGWAVVDNTSGEDWKGVRVGVGASSALSFRYDLWSVRTVDRELLAEEEQFAVAPPTGLSPYGGSMSNGVAVADNGPPFPGAIESGVLELGENEIRRRPGDAAGISYSGASSVENNFYVDSGKGKGKAKDPYGSIAGQVLDQATGEPLIGTTVVVESPQLSGMQTAITDENGAYSLRSLPPGQYVVTYYYEDDVIRRTGIVVVRGKATPLTQKLVTSGGETIVIQDTAPVIDPASTAQGITIDNDYIRNIPVPGRTYESALAAAAGAASDDLGVSFSGASSLDNVYYVDGVNTTGTGGGSDYVAPPAPTPKDGDRKIAALLSQLKGNRKAVMIESHAEAAIAGAESRARDRATVVRNQLIDAGVAPARISINTRVGSGEPERVRLSLVAPSEADEALAALGKVSTTNVSDTPVGESHFLATKPMNVEAGTSAMVSMFREETDGGVVYLYDPLSERGNRRYAFRAVRLDNPTADTLEPGPVTVYGDKRFIGEGLTDAIPPSSTAVVPFALDKQIVIDRSEDDHDEISKLVTLERGVLTVEVQHVRKTHLSITSRLHETTTLYIRHHVEDGWVLRDHPQSHSKSGDTQLFAVEIPAGETRDVLISEATPLQRTLQLASPSALGMLEVFVTSAEPSDELRAELTELLATHRAMGDAVERIETLRDQLAEYRQRSDELHGQLLTLKAVKTGGDLMKVLKQKMAEMSEREQRATLEIVESQEKLLIAKTEFANILAELRLPDALGATAAKGKASARK